MLLIDQKEKKETAKVNGEWIIEIEEAYGKIIFVQNPVYITNRQHTK